MLTQPAGCRFPLHFIISIPTHHPSKKSGKIFALWCKRLFSFYVTGCPCSEVILTTIAVIAEYWHSVWFQANTQKVKLCICFLPWAGRSTTDTLSVSACFREKALARCLQAKGLPWQCGSTSQPWTQVAAKNGWPLEPPHMPRAWRTTVHSAACLEQCSETLLEPPGQPGLRVTDCKGAQASALKFCILSFRRQYGPFPVSSVWDEDYLAQCTWQSWIWTLWRSCLSFSSETQPQ